MFKYSYEIEEGPSATNWSEYSDIVSTEYHRILDSDCSEVELQCFLEQHPCLLPTGESLINSTGKWPNQDTVFSQPKLTGLDTYVPDFMWIGRDSVMWYPTFVEIENPSKKLFNKKGYPTAEFTQARTQLDQWQAWFKNPNNQQLFRETFDMRDDWEATEIGLHLLLIYGRREEFRNNRRQSELRSQLLRPPAALMSFDRLKPKQHFSNLLMVRLLPRNTRRVLHVPPTFRVGPMNAGLLCNLDGLEAAIESNQIMSSPRKAFLIRRLPYWRDWASRDHRGFFGTGDWE